MTKSVTAVLLALVLGPGRSAHRRRRGCSRRERSSRSWPATSRSPKGRHAMPRGNVFFTDQPNDRILKWSANGKRSTFLEPGRAVQRHVLRRARQAHRHARTRRTSSGRSGPTARSPCWRRTTQGKPLNGPNDVWVRPDGGLYFTDPFYKRPWWKPATTGPRTASTSTTSRPTAGARARDRRPRTNPTGSSAHPTAKRSTWPTSARRRRSRYDIQPDGALDGQDACSASSAPTA